MKNESATSTSSNSSTLPTINAEGQVVPPEEMQQTSPEPAVNTRVYIACLMVMLVAVGPIVVMMLNLMREDNVDLFIGVFVAFFMCITVMMYAWRKRVSHEHQLHPQDPEVRIHKFFFFIYKP